MRLVSAIFVIRHRLDFLRLRFLMLRFLCFRPLAPTAIAVKGIYWHRFVAMVVGERVRERGRIERGPAPSP